MRLDFTKMHGLGNDFVVIDTAAGAPLPSADQWRQLSARHTGVGFDQALVLEPPRRAGTSVYYRIFNADGSEVEQCGNGARCIASYLHRHGRAGVGELTMDSPGGLVRARVHDAGLIAVDMGVPNFTPHALPFDASAEAPAYSLGVLGQQVEIGAVSIGNPHAVLTVPSVATAPVATLGPAIESHARFPRRVNVGFMQVVTRMHIRLRVFERGVGETLACGTGACAAVAIGRRRDSLDAVVRVDLPGGDLEVIWPGHGEHIWLKGAAAIAFEGRAEI
jgi:diaminopimelate epimerase